MSDPLPVLFFFADPVADDGRILKLDTMLNVLMLLMHAVRQH